LHGGKDQLDRDHTLHEFKTLVKTVLVATSVAGRGLDVPEIVLVINYNCPNHLEDYVHRVGRTGRAGRKGTAYTFISESEDQYASIMLKALKRADQIPPRELVELNEKYYEKVRHHEKDKIKFDFRKGKGFTFDAEEMNQSQRNASMQRKAFELEQGILPVDPAELADGEEEDEDEDEDEDDVVVTASSSNKATKYEIVAAADKALKMLPSTSSSLEKSRAIANTICSLKGLPSALSLNEVKVNMTIDARAALAKAKQIVKDMTASKEGEASQSGRFYTEELDINDYPPLARKKVTSKSGIAETIERHGIHIINRGKHVEKGKKPTDEGRLRIIIEGGSELSVKQSKAEIIRILEEETVKSIGGAAPAAGRYSVL
jgi:ATP-dependent RNA helicase DDX46/PRP5